MKSFVLLLALFAVSFSGSVGHQKMETEDALREVVFRHMFEHQPRQQRPYAKVLFISVEGKDPDDEFIARFKNHTPPVKRISESEFYGGGVMDKTSGEGGIRYNVGQVKWLGDDEAEVEGSYYVARLFAGGCSYRVIRDGDKWIAKGCRGKAWKS